jgi:methionyl-tRNA formyltransferase
VHDTMKEIGAQVLVKTVAGLAAGNLVEKAQTMDDRPQTTNSGQQSSIVCGQSSALRHAPKIFTETCKIDFSKTVEEVHNLIRGLSPFPGAFTFLDGKMLKIYKAMRLDGLQPSDALYETDGKTFLKFGCANGCIDVKELQLEGKKKMTVEDFLRGYRF